MELVLFSCIILYLVLILKKEREEREIPRSNSYDV